MPSNPIAPPRTKSDVRVKSPVEIPSVLSSCKRSFKLTSARSGLEFAIDSTVLL